MEKHCGRLERVGDLTGGELVTPVDRDGNRKWVGSFRVATEIDAIQIGGTLLKKPRCEDDLFQRLEPGEEACLYVYRHFRTPVLIGVKYADGRKFLITKSYLRGTILQFVTVLALMYGIGGFIAGGMLGGFVGIGEYGAALLGFGTIGWTWWQAVQVWQVYSAARAD